MKWENKNIVVTGGSSGIGLELVKGFLANGCKVVAASLTINNDLLSLESYYPFQVDLSTREGVDNLFDYALQTLESIDIFVANAGFAYYEILQDPNWEHILSIFGLNFNSVVYSAQKMKQLKGNKSYNFVTISSGMAILPLPGYALYSSTKAALKAFAEAYRWELNKGQYFQVVFPIATKTYFFKNAGNSPTPWPSQEPSVVAKVIRKGIKKNCNNIYPSKLFYSLTILNRIFPLLLKFYSYMEYKKLNNWLFKGKKENNKVEN